MGCGELFSAWRSARSPVILIGSPVNSANLLDRGSEHFAGGAGGGGNGASGGGSAGTVNTGSGGGASNPTVAGGNGGSGIVIIQIAGTYTATATTGSPTRTVSSGYTYYAYTATGSFTP